MLGNKNDLNYMREVSVDEGSKLAYNNNFYFKETSCVENKNISDIFQTIIEMGNFEIKKKNSGKNKSNCILF